jgi:hypothetical protein
MNTNNVCRYYEKCIYLRCGGIINLDCNEVVCRVYTLEEWVPVCKEISLDTEYCFIVENIFVSVIGRKEKISVWISLQKGPKMARKLFKYLQSNKT